MEWFLPINDRHQAGVDSCMGLGKICTLNVENISPVVDSLIGQICTLNVENISPVVDSLIDTISKYSWVG